MDNLISVFMNYKINRLIEYGVFAYQENSDFVREVFLKYFTVYVDNYYYGIFHTIEGEATYNAKNQKAELKGIMEEMLVDYRDDELNVSNEEYTHNRKVIHDLKDLSDSLLQLDWILFDGKNDIFPKVLNFISDNDVLRKYVIGRENDFMRLIRITYQTCFRLLNYEDNYYAVHSRLFEQHKDMAYLELVPRIKSLGTYRKSMVQKVYQDDKLGQPKVECLIQKVSLDILKRTLEKKEIPIYFIEISSSFVSRGKIKNEVMGLLSNPLFRNHVVLAVNYNTFLNQRSAFSIGYRLACIQDFVHINDIYQKVENIAKEEVFSYLIASDYRFKDRDFFVKYENDMMQMLLFEEE